MIVDAHAHVYRNPPGGREPASIDEYLALTTQNRVDAAVIVQPSFFGTNHEELVAAIASAPDRLRGVGAATSSFTHDEMQGLHEAGVRGIRLNYFRGASEDLTSAEWRRVLEMLQARGWHLELNVRDENMAAVLRMVEGLSIPITIDHFGRPETEKGAASPGFQALLGAAGKQPIYLKLTAVFRFPMECAKSCLLEWLDAVGPTRALWGSDCPWVEMNPAPSYRQTLDWLDDCVNSAEDRFAILGGNATTLYGFKC